METHQVCVHIYVMGKSSQCRSRINMQGGDVVSVISNPGITLVSGQVYAPPPDT